MSDIGQALWDFKLAAGISIAAARREVARRLRQAGIASPELDARLLIGHALHLDHTGLVANAARRLDAGEARAVTALAQRRLAREPVARIIGVKEFWGLPFSLNVATLVPRPETETVIEAALAALGDERGRRLRVADLGTGSGALLLALLSELPAANGIGTDRSMAALTCARDNARRLGLERRAAFVACDYAAALSGPLDLIVCNPPYVRSDDIATLEPEVRHYDPLLALDGGADGLDGYRAVLADAPRSLAPAGIFVLELGAGQELEVAAIAKRCGLVVRAVRHDLSGVARALAVTRSP